MGDYNDPLGGTDSTIGTQFRTDYYQKKALIEIRKEQYFSPLADVISMPKHMGKKIRRYHYLPVLDDANINDQGIDAAGLTTTDSVTIIIKNPDLASTGNGFVWEYAEGEDTTAPVATALQNAQAAAVDIFIRLGVLVTNYADTKTALELAGWTIEETAAVAARGNLYGSSKDVGTIVAKMPALTEHGGRVNRIGMKRIDLESNLEKYGMFYDYTKESLDFDTDAELDMHCTRELLNAANEITEDLIQIDLLNSAGVLRYGGDATITGELTGDTNDELNINASVLTYEDFMRMEIDLDTNRCPKQTKVISGSRMIDTRVINSGRVMYIGSELIPSVKRMTDLFGNQAFVGVEHYAHSGDIKGNPNTINGEIGTVGGFRIIVVPEMMHWAGAGAAVGAGGGTNPVNAGYRETGGNYDVFPLLVVGDASFTTVGFQTDGKTTKFKIKNVKPESDISYSAEDPFGEMGFSSLKFYYGFMVLRPERIALGKSVAEF